MSKMFKVGDRVSISQDQGDWCSGWTGEVARMGKPRDKDALVQFPCADQGHGPSRNQWWVNLVYLTRAAQPRDDRVDELVRDYLAS